ncbi:MAG TPA: PAS domain S-box protein, partial [Acidimicrobiia bacterium]
ARYRAFFDVLGEGLIVWGAEGRVVSCNRRAAEILGLPLERLSRLRLEELMDLADSEMQPIASDGSSYRRDAAPTRLAQRSGAVTGQVMGILRPDGRRVWLEVDVRSLTDEAQGELLVLSFRDITERKEAQDRTQLQANILEAIAQAVIVMEADGTIVYWNRAATELYGWRGDDALGQPVSEFLPADHTPDDISALLRTLRAGKVWSGDVEVQRRDGTMVSAFIVDTPVLGDDGRLSRIISVSTDVTERKRADDQMRALSAIVESSSDAIIRFGIDGMIESWNGGAQTLYGYSAEEVIGRHGSMLAPDDRAAEYEGVLAKVLWGQSVENLLTLAARRDGSAVHVAVTASPVYNADRTVVGMSVVAGNVDELVAARDALAESEERFRSLVQRSADVAFVVRRGVIQYASPAVERFGYTPDEVVGTSVWEYVHPDDVAQGHDRLMMALLMGQTVSLEGRIRTADGEWRWAEVVVTDMCDVAAIGGIVANVRDITDRRRAEQERGEAEERYTQGFERSSFGLAILDLRRTLTSVNPTLAEMLGYPVERLLGRTPIEFFHPSETDAARDGLERVLHPDAPAFYKREHRMIRADGSVVFVLIDTTVVHDCDDAPSYYFMQIHDITDRKRAEGALEHQALHDDLTRLPNRLLLVDRLSQSLARAKRTDTRVAVLFLDIDRFKLVNDGLGHGVGDQLLIEVAQRLASALRPSDTIARFGGDEFVVVCEDIRNE